MKRIILGTLLFTVLGCSEDIKILEERIKAQAERNNTEISVDDDWNSFIYIYNGKAKIANKSLNGGQLGVFSDSGIIDLHADGLSDLKCIIVGGEKLNEPVARGGPFVKNTKAEILKAFSDYQEGILTK